MPALSRTPSLQLLGLAALLAGCRSTPFESGIRIGDTTLEQFEQGATRESWVLAVLGEPTSSADVSDEPGVRILRYSMLEEQSPGVIASLLGSTTSRNVATIYFVVRDGVVERFWADRAEAGSLFSSDEESGEKKD